MAHRERPIESTDAHIPAYEGPASEQAVAIFNNLNDQMRSSYARFLERTARHIYPVVVARYSPGGGIYTLRVDAHHEITREPVEPGYSVFKSVAHLPLNAFVILGPYLDEPSLGQWKQPLRNWRESVMLCQNALGHTPISFAARQRNGKLLQATLDFIDALLEKGTFTREDLSGYANPLIPMIHRNQHDAALLQASGLTELLLTWRGMLGEDKWRETYFVIPCLWTLSEANAHAEICGNVMAEGRVDTHLIVAQGMSTIDDCLKLLARITGDRVGAGLIYNTAHPSEAFDLNSISSQRDLQAHATHAALERLDHGKFRGCGYHLNPNAVPVPRKG